ncbi:MAG: methyltransferase domain-containing protein [Gemmataceae bacterium]
MGSDSKRDPIFSSQYIHGTRPAEQARLSRMNDLINAGSLAEITMAGGERVLDVGSGLGQLTRALARKSGKGVFVIGVERSPEQLAEARRLADGAGEASLVDFRQGDALALPLRDEEWGSFDLAHARFLLEHVPDPLAVVRVLVRSVRPGGRIVLEDDSHDILRLTPEPPGFHALWKAYMRTYDRLANDPYIGHRLVSLLHEAGATPVRNSWIFFGGCQGDGRFDAFVENLVRILEGARAVVLNNSLLDAGSFADAMTALQRWSRLPDAALWFAISWAEGRRPVEEPAG